MKGMILMKDILLNKKWIGAAALVLYAVVVSMFFAKSGMELASQLAPTVEQEIDYFLPITIAGGEIVAPQETIISRTYGSGYDIRKIVLDTRSDELEPSALKDKGMFVSRKYVYMISGSKTEIRDLKNMPDMTLDRETVHSAMEFVQDKAGGYIFLFVFTMFLIFVCCAVGLYTLAMHWALAGIFHNGFHQTLRINTFAYIFVSVLSLLTGLNVGIIATFIILFGANFITNKFLQQSQA